MERWEANQLVEEAKMLFWLARHTAPFDEILVVENVFFKVEFFRNCLQRFCFKLEFYIENRIPYQLRRAYTFKDVDRIREYEKDLRANMIDDIPF